MAFVLECGVGPAFLFDVFCCECEDKAEPSVCKPQQTPTCANHNKPQRVQTTTKPSVCKSWRNSAGRDSLTWKAICLMCIAYFILNVWLLFHFICMLSRIKVIESWISSPSSTPSLCLSCFKCFISNHGIFTAYKNCFISSECEFSEQWLFEFWATVNFGHFRHKTLVRCRVMCKCLQQYNCNERSCSRTIHIWITTEIICF